MTTQELNKKYGERHCICGEQLVPKKRLFGNNIIYHCPKSNIFNRKKHSTSRAVVFKIKTIKIGVGGIQ